MSDKIEKGALKKTIIFGTIAKSLDQSDGTVIVEGYASSGAVDAEGETITPDAMKSALPDYMKFANIREMHKSNAAGVALHAEVQDDGRTFLRAHVVDPVAVLKVRTGTYKGFSIGGYVEGRDEANKAIITKLRLVEVSLVDRPCNPDAVFACYKAEGVDGENENDGGTGDGEKTESGEGGDDPPKTDDKDKKKDGKDAAGDDESAGSEDDDQGEDTDKAIGAGDLAKGCYAISDLAQLCERLEDFGNYQAFEASFDAGSEDIANEARAIAVKLYGLLLKLVNADVSRARERLQAALAEAKTASLSVVLEGALAKIKPAAPAATPVDVPAVLKAAGVEDDAIDTIEKAAAELARLRKIEQAWKDAPAAAKGSLTKVEKTGDDTLATKTEGTDEPETPLSAIKKALASGGTRVGR